MTATYNSYGKLVGQKDELGRVITNTYNTSNLKTSEENPLGEKTGYGYGEGGHQTVITNPLGFTRKTEYLNRYGGPNKLINELGQATEVSYSQYGNQMLPGSVTDSLGKLGGYDFDEKGSVTTRSDGNDKATAFTYDAYGNKSSETDPLGYSSYFSYDAMGRVISATNAGGVNTKYEYDALGRLITTTHALGLGSLLETRTVSEYDGNGNQTASLDDLGRRTSYEYDVLNRQTVITYPNSTTQRFSYDYRGQRLTETDQGGRLTRHRYDGAGQLISTTVALNSDGTANPDTATMLYEYDGAGRKVREYNPYAGAGTLPANHPFTTYGYDAAGRMITHTNQLLDKTVYSYDKAGRKTGEKDALNRITSFGYDQRGRMSVITYPNATYVRHTYDGAGNVLTKSDQGERTTTYSYDPLNRLLSVSNPDLEKTSYSYDRLGRLTSLSNPKNVQTKFEYDALNRQVRKVWPDNSFESYGYDEVGNRTSHRLADGSINTMQYDTLNRLVRVNYFDITTPTLYTYTLTGHRQSASNENGVTTYSYDSRERVTRAVGPLVGQSITQSIAYTYDAASNRKSLTSFVGTNQQASVSYHYDAAHQLKEVVDTDPAAPGDKTARYTYNEVGLRTKLELPNGVRTEYGYDPNLNRLTSLTQSKGAEPVLPLARYTYSYDQATAAGKASMRTGLVEEKGGVVVASLAWQYDAANRITGETIRNASNAITSTSAFAYDDMGNRTSMVTGNGGGSTLTTSYTYNELDQLLSASSTTTSEQYGYDRRGNLIQVKNASTGVVQRTYQWNGADRLTGVSIPGSSATGSYKYNPDGKRVQQSANGTTTNYLWDEFSRYGDVALETNSTGSLVTSYVLGTGCGMGCGSAVAGELISQKKAGGTLSYYLFDGQGSVRDLTGTTGNVTESYTYDTFGKLTSGQASPASSYLYTGQQYDNLSELYSLRARYYEPKQGRFLSQDTWEIATNEPSELNRYNYVVSNPINSIDPSGNYYIILNTLTRPSAGWLIPLVSAVFLAMLLIAALLQDITIPIATTGQHHEDKDSTPLFFFHGTNVQSAENIKNLGIQSIPNISPQMGDGFYTYPRHLTKEALQLARERAGFVSGNATNIAVVALVMLSSTYKNLKKMNCAEEGPYIAGADRIIQPGVVQTVFRTRPECLKIINNNGSRGKVQMVWQYNDGKGKWSGFTPLRGV